jgi:hypothetical protein
MGVNDDIRPLPAGPVELDDDGNPVPQPAADSDVRDLQQLMEWGRMKGYRIGPAVRIGKITVQIADVRQTEGRRSAEDDEPDDDFKTVMNTRDA